jgi:hypothetical protein
VPRSGGGGFAYARHPLTDFLPTASDAAAQPCSVGRCSGRRRRRRQAPRLLSLRHSRCLGSSWAARRRLARACAATPSERSLLSSGAPIRSLGRRRQCRSPEVRHCDLADTGPGRQGRRRSPQGDSTFECLGPRPVTQLVDPNAPTRAAGSTPREASGLQRTMENGLPGRRDTPGLSVWFSAAGR